MLHECTWLIAESLTYVWAKRMNREQMDTVVLKSTLKNKAKFMVNSRKYSEAGRRIINTIDNTY